MDPTIEKLCFEQNENKTFIHLKFKGEDELLLNKAEDLEQYLSSGTIKGMITFSMVKDILQSGGYLLVDEIENHFNKEIVNIKRKKRDEIELAQNNINLNFSYYKACKEE